MNLFDEPPSRAGDIRLVAVDRAETETAIVHADLRPYGLVDLHGLLEPARWVDAGPPPSAGQRVAVHRDSGGGWLAGPIDDIGTP